MSQRKKSKSKQPKVITAPAAVAPAETAPVPAPPTALSDEQLRELIAVRAYELYQQRGGERGDQVSDWLQAEAEVLASIRQPAKALASAAGS
jgi:hypothetical protein